MMVIMVTISVDLQHYR